ncbi:DUF2007 domain-containing protein [Aquimonas voraii]|uniref:Putative signal transducing protein n=1 Tax=Aquimonas voraii TaxID=265719 RepID=A0A1G6U562_9GAMM|nr:DUF2007 domain-containing protein [Aquimonas voraii]SDD36459.1 Putative signal transducing protein [Aquimonas voraii]
MRKVYEADSYIDAQITRGWLEAAGVPSLLAGEHLGGAIGELPVAGLHSLWVGDDFEHAARAALAELAAQRDEGAEGEGAAASDDGLLPA